MNENEQLLLNGLRGLAEDGPQEAPAHVEERLMAEFRRRSRARRVRVWLGSGIAAIAAGVMLMIWMRPQPPRAAPVVAHAVVQPVAGTVVGKAGDEKRSPALLRSAPAARKIRASSQQAAMSFYRLPQADELPPVENATVVRVQLPMSSLRLIGFPVNEERAAERVQADVLVGQDGLARGVRFVQ